jgi:hypothetical protein
MQTIYAEIRPDSKYASQASLQKSQGMPYPFPVQIGSDKTGNGFVVKGGIGGQYRLEDVHLIAYTGDGDTVRIS